MSEPAQQGQNPGQLGGMFDAASASSARAMQLVKDPEITQIVINRFDRVWVTHTTRGPEYQNTPLFPNENAYTRFVNDLLAITNAGYRDVTTAKTPVIEASFSQEPPGAVHVCTPEITGGQPVVTIRKQPREFIRMQDMVSRHRMLNADMMNFLAAAMYGRLNILISGGSGAGKTTFARALAQFIDPEHRIVTCEETRELRLDDRLTTVAPLLTNVVRDEEGRVLRQATLEDLVKEALRMRAHRIWVGEVRGAEAFALTQAAVTGHDGSVTTLHADNGGQAIRQLVTYVTMAGLEEPQAASMVAHAFDLVVHIEQVQPDRRVVTEITELQPVREALEQRRQPLYQYDWQHDAWSHVGQPSPLLQRKLYAEGANA